MFNSDRHFTGIFTLYWKVLLACPTVIWRHLSKLLDLLFQKVILWNQLYLNVQLLHSLSLQYVLTCLLGPLKEKCALLEKSSHWAGKECQILTERIRNTRSKLGNLRYKYLVYIFSHILEKKQSCNIGKLGTVTVWQTNQCMGGENTHINDYIMITGLKQ